ncbi:hypothetical protein RUND412_000568 [Rhizina undulata]
MHSHKRKLQQGWKSGDAVGIPPGNVSSDPTGGASTTPSASTIELYRETSKPGRTLPWVSNSLNTEPGIASGVRIAEACKKPSFWNYYDLAIPAPPAYGRAESTQSFIPVIHRGRPPNSGPLNSATVLNFSFQSTRRRGEFSFERNPVRPGSAPVASAMDIRVTTGEVPLPGLPGSGMSSVGAWNGAHAQALAPNGPNPTAQPSLGTPLGTYAPSVSSSAWIPVSQPSAGQLESHAGSGYNQQPSNMPQSLQPDLSAIQSFPALARNTPPVTDQSPSTVAPTTCESSSSEYSPPPSSGSPGYLSPNNMHNQIRGTVVLPHLTPSIIAPLTYTGDSKPLLTCLSASFFLPSGQLTGTPASPAHRAIQLPPLNPFLRNCGRDLFNIPHHVLLIILEHLPLSALVSLMAVNKYLRSMVQYSTTLLPNALARVWRPNSLCTQNEAYLYYLDPDLNQLMASTIECIGADWAGKRDNSFVRFVYWRHFVVSNLERVLHAQFWRDYFLSPDEDQGFERCKDPARGIIIKFWRNESRESRQIVLHKLWQLSSLIRADTRAKFERGHKHEPPARILDGNAFKFHRYYSSPGLRKGYLLTVAEYHNLIEGYLNNRDFVADELEKGHIMGILWLLHHIRASMMPARADGSSGDAWAAKGTALWGMAMIRGMDFLYAGLKGLVAEKHLTRAGHEAIVKGIGLTVRPVNPTMA